MKKLAVILLTVLSTVMILSFTTSGAINENEFVVTVTADKETHFDMTQDEKTVKRLKTPYETTFKITKSKFVFQSEHKSNLKVKVRKSPSTGEATAEGHRVVLSVDDGHISISSVD